jgi:superfamily II DNA or RNA helicase
VGVFDELAAQFDPVDNNHKGDQFELVCKWFLENDPMYQPLLRAVWLWDDWPGPEDGVGPKGIDAGIDLVAEDSGGKLWAIQAKAYNPAYSISKDDINSFVAESSREHFTHRLLIGTTDKRHHLATKLMDDLGIPFVGLTRLRKADDYLDWPASPDALRPATPLDPKEPWDYQQAAISEVVKGFETSDRGQLIMACGTGKTLTAWFIHEKLESYRAARAAALGPGHADGWPWKTLVLVPSLSLLKQTLTEWRLANPRAPFEAMVVCSDESVGSLGPDAAVSHTSDLGVPVTTDHNMIATFLRHRTGPARVVFATYQSSPQIAAAFDLSRNEDGSSQTPGFDLVIADEAHRVAGPVSSDFATVLDPTAIVAKRRLFMTATPRYFTGRVLKEAKQADYEVASMDDTEKFGEVFHRLSFAEAIDRDLLTDYQVAIIGVDDATYREWAENGALVTLDGKKITDARSLAGQIGLAKAMKKFDLRRVISFHSRVKASRDFAASMPAVLDWMPSRQRPKGKLWSRHASGEMSAGEREFLLQRLKRLDDGECGLLSNARCLSEGVDVPALDGVAFIDPRRSEVDIVQAVGRAIRKSDNKVVGTIVIPVFIDTAQDAEVALDSSVFKPVWDVIKALRAHDAELGEQLDELRREMGRKGGKPKLPSKIYVDVPTTVGKDFVNAFEARLVDATTAPWEFWYGLLEKYVAEHGSTRVPKLHKVDGHPLGQWLARQRGEFANGALDPSRQRRLEELASWSWAPHTDAWEEGYSRLVEYVGEHGHARVPRPVTVDGYRLGQWVGVQRGDFANGSLNPSRQQRLAELPGWSWDPHTDKWEEGYARLVEYVDDHGDARVPQPYRAPEGFRLGAWVQRQRGEYANGSLDRSRQQRLAELPGWSWNARADKWEEGYARLVKYVGEHGDARVPYGYRANGYSLGQWVAGQRSSSNRRDIPQDRRMKLEALPGWAWDARSNDWEDGFARMREYAEHSGDCLVKAKYMSPDGFRLGGWVNTQRTAFTRGSFDPERQRRLEALPGWSWDPFEDRWSSSYAILRQYTAEHGHARVPNACIYEGIKLGQWVYLQRNAYSEGKLSDDRRQRLETLPGWVWSAPHGPTPR